MENYKCFSQLETGILNIILYALQFASMLLTFRLRLKHLQLHAGGTPVVRLLDANCTPIVRQLYAIARRWHAGCTPVRRQLHANCTPIVHNYTPVARQMHAN